MAQIYRVDLDQYKIKDCRDIVSARKIAYSVIQQCVQNQMGSYFRTVYTIVRKPDNTIDGVTVGTAYNFGKEILWKNKGDAHSYKLKQDGTLGLIFQFGSTVYIIGIWEGDRGPWRYILTKNSQTACRKYLINNMPKKVDARGVIEKADGSKIEKEIPMNNMRLKDHITHQAKWCETILWDSEHGAWRSWSPSDNDVIKLINSDGTIRKVKVPLKYLNIPSLNTSVSWTDDRKHIEVSWNHDMVFYFTKGGKCVEIWDVHTGEEIIIKGKELEGELKGYYKGIYEKSILPSLKKFLIKIKKQI